MGSLTISNKILEKYFGYLKSLDKTSKKNLIDKLSDSLTNDKKKHTTLISLFGSWEDNRDSDEIISEIKSSRINNSNLQSFE